NAIATSRTANRDPKTAWDKLPAWRSRRRRMPKLAASATCPRVEIASDSVGSGRPSGMRTHRLAVGRRLLGVGLTDRHDEAHVQFGVTQVKAVPLSPVQVAEQRMQRAVRF